MANSPDCGPQAAVEFTLFYHSEKLFARLFSVCGNLPENEKCPGLSLGDIRKQRRKRPAFAGLQRQSPLTTTKGACEAFPCTPIKIEPFPVQSSPGPRSGQDPSGVLDRLGGLRSRAGASLTRPQPVPQDFGCRKYEKGRSKPWWLARPFEYFVRQNPTAEPLFSYVTPAFQAAFFALFKNK